ncbi:GNAT family N-acetyltransferase [Chloroflexota bacterium]
MSNPASTIRNYHSTDFDRLIRLASEGERLKQAWYRGSRQYLCDSIGRPSFCEYDLLVAELADDIRGYAIITPEPGIGRIVVSYLVHPEYGKDLTTKLIDGAAKRAAELSARRIHVNVPQDNVSAKRLLGKMGFRMVRRFLELRLDLAHFYPLNSSDAGSPCRQLNGGEEGMLTELQNRCFAGTWGYNPSATEGIIYRTNLPGCSTEDVILVCDADKPVGYCWTRVTTGENASPSENSGYIHMLGVDPDYQGQEIGKKVLLAGLVYLKGKGMKSVQLTVDNDNKIACALYRSTGFKPTATIVWYEKVLG